MENKRVVILAGPGESTNIVYHALKEHFKLAKVIIEKPVDQSTFLKRRMKKLGFPTVIGQILFKLFVSNSLEKKSQGRKEQILAKSGLTSSAIPEPEVLHVGSVNSEECINALKQLEPAVVVVNGTRIISKRVLESSTATFINMHAGITPLYRGVHGGYWALANQDKENCGVTVHLVDSGIDTGNILYQARINPTTEDNFATYPLLQLVAGLPYLKKAVQDALSKNVKLQSVPPGKSKLWSHPTLFEYRAIKKKFGVR